MNIEHQYLAAMAGLGAHGVFREGRNGNTFSMFGHQMRHDMREGFPLLTTKKVHFKSIAVELLWFLKGDTNTKYLHDHGVTIWDEWADDKGNLGPVYGSQWRSWPQYKKYPGGEVWEVGVIDQIHNLIRNLKRDPFSRRHIVTAWNPNQIEDMALPPCHAMFQFYASPRLGPTHNDTLGEYYLDLQLYQRSGDWFLGVPFNIASYALLLQIVAREVGMVPRYFVHSFGDYHLYENHVAQAEEQVMREPRPLPKVLVVPDFEKSLFDLQYGDFALVDYDPHPAIRAEVSK